MFYYADEFNLTWLPGLIAMWSPKGQQVMLPTPGQTKKHYGIGAVNYHTGEKGPATCSFFWNPWPVGDM